MPTTPSRTPMITLGKAASTFAHSNQLVAFQARQQGPAHASPTIRVSKPVPVAATTASRRCSSRSAPRRRIKEDVGQVHQLLHRQQRSRADPSASSAASRAKHVDPRQHRRPTVDGQGQIALNYVSTSVTCSARSPPPPDAAGEIEPALLRAKSQEVGFGQLTPQSRAMASVPCRSGGDPRPRQEA